MLSRVRKLFSATARTPIFSTLSSTTTLSIGSSRTASAIWLHGLPVAHRIARENAPVPEHKIRSPVLTSPFTAS